MRLACFTCNPVSFATLCLCCLFFSLCFFCPYPTLKHTLHTFYPILPIHLFLPQLTHTLLPSFPSCCPQPPTVSFLLLCQRADLLGWSLGLYLPSCLNCTQWKSQSCCKARWGRRGVERQRGEGPCLHTDECIGHGDASDRHRNVCQGFAQYILTRQHCWIKETGVFFHWGQHCVGIM